MPRRPKPRARHEGEPGRRSSVSHRKIAESARVGQARAPRMPRSLPDEAKVAWRIVVPALREAMLLREVDVFALEALCIAVARHRQARRHVKRRGLVVEGQRGMVTNPAVKIEREAATEIAKWSERLGLDPRARMALGQGGERGRSAQDELRATIGDSPRLTALDGGRRG